MSIARNDPCPCGSGQKYKRCCEGTRGAALSPSVLILGFVVLIGTALALTAVLDMPDRSSADRVWSEEHGHWHTVQETEEGALNDGPVPQPPGPVPPGKVWSVEHGHWHDAS